ncbi:MAG TPA: hypothetical protein V6D07_07740 [Trichocoleus sp.]
MALTLFHHATGFMNRVSAANPSPLSVPATQSPVSRTNLRSNREEIGFLLAWSLDLKVCR